MNAAALLLSLHFVAGQVWHQHADILDRTHWLLPPARLEAFRRGGTIIDEETRTSISAAVTVRHVSGSVARFSGTAHVTTLDVPRARLTSAATQISSKLTASNHSIGTAQLEVGEAATADLPTRRLRLGSIWTTKESVSTAFGSGTLTLTHVITALDSDIVEIAITGRGTITRSHLLKLLPGSIELHGTAWFNPHQGIFVHESYAAHDVLAKPVGGARIGFDETQWIEVTQSAGRR